MRQELLARGVKESQLKLALREGRLHRLRPGAFVAGSDWDAAYAEERHLLKILAADAAVPCLC